MGVEIIEMKKRTPEDRDAYLAIKVAEGKARIRELEAENERLDESVTWHAAENERHIRELEEARARLDRAVDLPSYGGRIDG